MSGAENTQPSVVVAAADQLAQPQKLPHVCDSSSGNNNNKPVALAFPPTTNTKVVLHNTDEYIEDKLRVFFYDADLWKTYAPNVRHVEYGAWLPTFDENKQSFMDCPHGAFLRSCAPPIVSVHMDRRNRFLVDSPDMSCVRALILYRTRGCYIHIPGNQRENNEFEDWMNAVFNNSSFTGVLYLYMPYWSCMEYCEEAAIIGKWLTANEKLHQQFARLKFIVDDREDQMRSTVKQHMLGYGVRSWHEALGTGVLDVLCVVPEDGAFPVRITEQQLLKWTGRKLDDVCTVFNILGVVAELEHERNARKSDAARLVPDNFIAFELGRASQRLGMLDLGCLVNKLALLLKNAKANSFAHDDDGTVVYSPRDAELQLYDILRFVETFK